MSINVSLHRSGGPLVVKGGSSGSTFWLEFSRGTGDVSVFFDENDEGAITNVIQICHSLLLQMGEYKDKMREEQARSTSDADAKSPT